MKSISEQSMWQAVAECDVRYDGQFCYGVKTTGVFCRPSCKSRLPRRENTVFFACAAAAIGQGFRPCKRCRPDSPAFAPEQDVILAARALLESEFANPAILAQLPRRIGLSRSHLARLFKQHTRFTPREFLHAVRIGKAQDMLVASQLTGTRIGYEVGFNTPSRFFAAFRALTGLSPCAWRLTAAAAERRPPNTASFTG